VYSINIAGLFQKFTELLAGEIGRIESEAEVGENNE
jgi:hypothetical protein